MDIRTKTLAALGISFVLLYCILAGVLFFQYPEDLRQLEHQQVQDDVRSALNAIENEQDDLSATLHDWAYWNDTYQFASDHNNEYIAQNLDASTLSGLGLNLFVITDLSGNIVYSTMADTVNGQAEPPKPDIGVALPPSHNFFSHTNLTSTNSAILLLGKSPMIIVSTPILTNDRKGPAQGVLVMGRYLDQQTLKKIAKVTGHQLLVYPAEEGSEYGHLDIPAGSAILSVPRSDTIITGYTVIRDINGRTIMVVLDLPRDLYRQGLSTIQRDLVLFTGIIFITALVVIFVIDRAVLERLAALTRKVSRLRNEPNLLLKPELTGNDEIALLEKEIISSHSDLVFSERNLRTFIDAVTDPAAMLKVDGSIILGNTALACSLGKEISDLNGTYLSTYLKHDELKLYTVFFNQAVLEKKIVHFEFEFNGKTYLVSFYPSFGQTGETEQVAALTLDITDRKRVEDALRSVTKKINLLNTVIFNDIQNKVFAQLGYIDLAKRSAHDPATLAFLEKQRSAALEIQDSLDFTRQYQTMGVDPPKWQNVNEVILYAFSHLDIGQVKKDLDLDGLEIYADPLLERVFFNLIENSLRHGYTTRTIKAWYREIQGSLVLTIEDDGIGIDPMFKEKIFTKGSGAGGSVGLFLSREILSITRISIVETSGPGKGARFEITVPAGAYRIVPPGT